MEIHTQALCAHAHMFMYEEHTFIFESMLKKTVNNVGMKGLEWGDYF